MNKIVINYFNYNLLTCRPTIYYNLRIKIVLTQLLKILQFENIY